MKAQIVVRGDWFQLLINGKCRRRKKIKDREVNDSSVTYLIQVAVTYNVNMTEIQVKVPKKYLPKPAKKVTAKKPASRKPALKKTSIKKSGGEMTIGVKVKLLETQLDETELGKVLEQLMAAKDSQKIEGDDAERNGCLKDGKITKLGWALLAEYGQKAEVEEIDPGEGEMPVFTDEDLAEISFHEMGSRVRAQVVSEMLAVRRGNPNCNCRLAFEWRCVSDGGKITGIGRTILQKCNRQPALCRLSLPPEPDIPQATPKPDFRTLELRLSKQAAMSAECMVVNNQTARENILHKIDRIEAKWQRVTEMMIEWLKVSEVRVRYLREMLEITGSLPENDQKELYCLESRIPFNRRGLLLHP